MSDRLQEILSLFQTFPNDPFVQYGLAMEYKTLGQLEKAAQIFSQLQARQPEYVAQYLMHGNVLCALKKFVDAREVYQKGQEVAQHAQNFHALSELTQALENLEMQEDE